MGPQYGVKLRTHAHTKNTTTLQTHCITPIIGGVRYGACISFKPTVEFRQIRESKGTYHTSVRVRPYILQPRIYDVRKAVRKALWFIILVPSAERPAPIELVSRHAMGTYSTCDCALFFSTGGWIEKKIFKEERLRGIKLLLLDSKFLDLLCPLTV